MSLLQSMTVMAPVDTPEPTLTYKNNDALQSLIIAWYGTDQNVRLNKEGLEFIEKEIVKYQNISGVQEMEVLEFCNIGWDYLDDGNTVVYSAWE